MRRAFCSTVVLAFLASLVAVAPAHAREVTGVPGCSPTAVVWGIQRGVDVPFVYGIDPVGGTATFVSDTGKNDAEPNYPNGVAYDVPTDRLYYAERTGSTSQLHFYDFAGNHVPAGELAGVVAGATIHNGVYYYIPQQTGDLYAALLLADGTIGSNVLIKSDVSGAGSGYVFGDMVVSADGSTMYVNAGTGGSSEFFSVDLSGEGYNLIAIEPSLLQLAFGVGDDLYGHNANTGMFYLVDTTTGGLTEIGTVTGSETGVFTDLASYQSCDSSPPPPICDGSIAVWGIQRGVDVPFVYGIDPVGGTATFVSDTGKNDAEPNYPNGVAYDVPTDRLYYAERTGATSQLHFYDFAGNHVPAGELAGVVAGATIHNGVYYYIPQQTGDLYAALLLADGTIGSNVLIKSDVSGAGSGYVFGDMVVSADGSTMYVNAGTGGSSEFFSVDLSGEGYNLIAIEPSLLQLAFDVDGDLYGHNANTGMFYLVDTTTGGLTEIGTVAGSETGVFTDLGSYIDCDPPS